MPCIKEMMMMMMIIIIIIIIIIIQFFNAGGCLPNNTGRNTLLSTNNCKVRIAQSVK